MGHQIRIEIKNGHTNTSDCDPFTSPLECFWRVLDDVRHNGVTMLQNESGTKAVWYAPDQIISVHLEEKE